MTPLWITNISILYEKKYLFEIIPLKNFDFNHETDGFEFKDNIFLEPSLFKNIDDNILFHIRNMLSMIKINIITEEINVCITKNGIEDIQNYTIYYILTCIIYMLLGENNQTNLPIYENDKNENDYKELYQNLVYYIS